MAAFQKVTPTIILPLLASSKNAIDAMDYISSLRAYLVRTPEVTGLQGGQ